MSDELKPALTPKEWRMSITVREAADRYPMEATMALANDSLPADSPYKITRADVALLRESADTLWNSKVAALAAKLAALLPPETPA